MIIALMLGGILSELGYIQTIVETLLVKIKNVGTLITATIFSGIFFQATTCNTMVSRRLSISFVELACPVESDPS